MTFDPFGDYATRGYLRNTRGADEILIKRLEHAAFRSEVDAALDYLKSKSVLTYEDVLQTHANLFSSVYPWAGQDRMVTAPESAIGKNGNFKLFAHPADSRRAVDMALDMAAVHNTMRAKPGEIMGQLAYAHPFLDGNGRTIMTVHADMCRRAGMSIDWSKTKKADYLNALTKELEAPGKGHLDVYLKPFIRIEPLDRAQSADMLRGMPGLSPSVELKPILADARHQAQTQPLAPSVVLATEVSRQEIEGKIAQSASLTVSLQNIETSTAKVFADPRKALDAINEAAMSGKIGDKTTVEELRQSPQDFGVFRGKNGMLVSPADRKARAEAESEAVRLAAVAGRHVSLVHGIRSALQSEKEMAAGRARVEVPAPTAGLIDAIGKGRSLSPTHKSELVSLMAALDQRFGSDLSSLRSGAGVSELAAKHRIDAKRLERASAVLKTLDKGQQSVRAEARAQIKAQAPDRGGPVR
jgi:fido (protein-threonine AMPylation protein)